MQRVRIWKHFRKGSYKVSEKVFSALAELFAAGCCDDTDTERTIRRIYEKYGYLCDTHTAVALNVYAAYKTKTGDSTPTVIASTANPYKFPKRSACRRAGACHRR